MRNEGTTYDVAIIGGGLAGLSLSIQLAQKGYSVVLFEKETYPYHKVCGEYISLESWNFLESLGVPLKGWSLPIITTLQLTAANGAAFTTPLPLGGFGISRFLLDSTLATIAKEKGVAVIEAAKVQEVDYRNDLFHIQLLSALFGQPPVCAKLCFGAFGKRSNLDVKWKRDFIQSKPSPINNYVGVKYHVKVDWPEAVIGLHNFSGGYCGISKIEEDRYCLCYMTTANQLKNANNSIQALEQNLLYRNPGLKKIFTSAEVVAGFPVTISQISFDKKSQAEQQVVLLGDAAGMITPLCGNGMSIALHSSKIAASLADPFFQHQISLSQLVQQYQHHWRNIFAKRLQIGRVLQHFFGRNTISNIFVHSFKIMPFLASTVIKKTHGTPF